MSDVIKYDETTDTFYAKGPEGFGWRVVSLEQARKIENSGVENFAEAAIDSTQDVGSTLSQMAMGVNPFEGFGERDGFFNDMAEGFGDTIQMLNPLGAVRRAGDALGFDTSDPITDRLRSDAEANNPRQAAGMQEAPVAEVLGGLFDPTMLVGGSIPKIALKFAGRGAAVKGAAGQWGQTAVDVSNKGSVNAAAVSPAISGAFEGRRPLNGLLTPSQADEIGIPLTTGDRLALGAGTPGNPSANYGLGLSVRRQEEVRRSREIGSIGQGVEAVRGLKGKSVTAIREAQETYFTRFIATTLGDPNIETFTMANRAELRKEIQNVFKEAIDNNPNPIPGNRVAQEVAELADVATGNAQSVAINQAQNIASKVGVDGNFTSSAYSSVRKELVDKMESAFGGGNHELGSTLSKMVEHLDDALESTLEPAVREALTEARMRWRIMKALERGRTVSRESAELNIASFETSYKAVTPAYKRAARQPDELERIMETLSFTTSKAGVGNSGTAERAINALMGSRPAGIVTGVGTVAAVGSLAFGR